MGSDAGVVLLNLGGPDRPESVKPFLLELFNDPAVLDLPGGAPVRRALAWLIAAMRAPKVRRIYEEVGGSPLLSRTLAQERALEKRLNEGEGAGAPRFFVRTAMRYWRPRATEAVRELLECGAKRLIALPLYPQFCRATTGSSLKELREVAAREAPGVPLEEIESFARDAGYLDALAACVQEGLWTARSRVGVPESRSIEAAEPTLLFSAHGVPRRLVEAGDPYLEEIHATVAGVVARLAGFRGRHLLSFQSRAGPVKWVEPATDATIERLGSQGCRSLVIVPVSFVSDHIETVHEIDVLLAGKARAAGIPIFVRTPPLDVRPDFIAALTQVVRKRGSSFDEDRTSDRCGAIVEKRNALRYGGVADLLVVGGGMAGLLAAWRARRARPQARVLVLEAGPRPGGVVASVREDGFLIERAASTMRAGAGAILEVVRELGLEGELVEASRAARRRWILRRGELVQVPSSPLGLFTTRLLSARAKLRLFQEPWVARGGGGGETLADFVARRFGRELVDPLLDAIVTGIFAGDPRQLEAGAVFPKLVELEERHGSLLRGFVKEARARRRAGDPAAAATAAVAAAAVKTRESNPRRRGLLALRGGMQQLVDRLESELGEVVQTGAAAAKLALEQEGGAGGPLWRVESANGRTWRARSLLIATPALASARLLAPIEPDLALELAAIPCANVAVVGIGVRREQIGADVDGLGFLVPSSEGTPLLGVLYESSLFPHRAPEGHVLLRAMIGGERTQFPDDPRAVAGLAWLETSRILRISGKPRLLRPFLHRPGIPQYRPGHCARMERIEEHLARLPGLRLAGWSYRGIALDDRARESAS
jgi:ferrochelatase/protoporphyrinogen oxidase